jgi:hypothetical protein
MVAAHCGAFVVVVVAVTSQPETSVVLVAVQDEVPEPIKKIVSLKF